MILQTNKEIMLPRKMKIQRALHTPKSNLDTQALDFKKF